MNFAITPNASPVSAENRRKLLEDPGFGRIFTDHMVTLRWTADKGWHDGEVKARAPFAMDPASAVLHYAQEIFEGMKAYRTGDGQVVLFRPDMNASRFNRSAERLAMPTIPESLFIEAVKALVKIDQEWVTRGAGSLYLRPFMFASEAFLGVRPALEYIFCVIASPVGPYFKGGDKLLKLWVSDEYTRAAPGGTGAAKCGGNYAASLIAQAEAARHGCDQVVFLDAAEHRWIEELGGMNLFFVMNDGSIITPPLTGTILPGITRASIIEIARSLGMQVKEAPYSLDQWRSDAQSGRLSEAFACGTAAVVASIGEIVSSKDSFRFGNGVSGPVSQRLKEQLVGIQRGTVPDTRGWVQAV
ncbi:MAG TPA: branched-chain amino acid aminotransferase [Steroidobacter sp.]|uniref:branched-chain amino acid aminotransferase n=1 Tax=Steroidobacter sp. TaxID=1978227 RepID=UPI002ED930EF